MNKERGSYLDRVFESPLWIRRCLSQVAGLNATAEYNATQPTSCFFQLKTCFLLIFIIDAAACVFTAPYAYHVELARVSDAEDAVSENSIWIQISTVTVTTLEQ